MTFGRKIFRKEKKWMEVSGIKSVPMLGDVCGWTIFFDLLGNAGKIRATKNPEA
jgi:hypothetical protein